MRKMVPILMAVLLAGVSWIFFSNFKIDGLHHVRVAPRTPGTPASDSSSSAWQSLSESVSQMIPSGPASDTPGPPPTAKIPSDLPSIRIATFHVHRLDREKVYKPQVLDLLARVGRQFDVIAVQHIRSNSDSIISRLIRMMNASGAQYDYAISPRVGPRDAREQYGFVFNRKTVMLDRKELYVVDDRDDLVHFEPFVGWFRTIGPPADEAFTFSLINLRIHPDVKEQELAYLDDILHAVRNDGREEDDIILAGDLQSQPDDWPNLQRLRDLGFAVNRIPTNVEQSQCTDNLVFQKTATCEFTGNAGVFDFLREFNLTMDQALEISNHLPVWAEFSIVEGGEAGRVAADSMVDELH